MAERTISVLVADDEDMFRNLVLEMLRSRHFECEDANDGDSVLRRLQTRHFDVLICDIKMPGNEDMALIHRVIEGWPELKIIMMTGYPTLDTAVAALRLTVCDYLTKPFVLDTLIGAVHKCMAQGSADRLFQQSHTQIDEWSAALQQLVDVNVHGGEPDAFRMQKYIGLTLRNMAGCIEDLGAATRFSLGNAVEPAGKGAPCQYFNCVRFTRMKECLQHVEIVLEQTRRSFKSKELQQLRVFVNEELDAMVSCDRIGDN